MPPNGSPWRCSGLDRLKPLGYVIVDDLCRRIEWFICAMETLEEDIHDH